MVWHSRSAERLQLHFCLQGMIVSQFRTRVSLSSVRTEAFLPVVVLSRLSWACAGKVAQYKYNLIVFVDLPRYSSKAILIQKIRFYLHFRFFLRANVSTRKLVSNESSISQIRDGALPFD